MPTPVFGNAVGTARTVRLLERAGAASIQLEDQVFPKRCGHFTGKEVVPTAEMVNKIRSAVDSRASERTLIIARTDARATDGLDAAIDRAGAYRAAGADTPRSLEEMRAVRAALDGPLLANMVEGGLTPILGADVLGEVGYSIVLYANAALRAAQFNVDAVLDVLRRDGTTGTAIDRMAGWEERQEAVGKSYFDAWQERSS